MAMTDSPTIRSRRRAEADHRQRLGRVDLDEGEVGFLVEGEDAGGVPGAVVQPDAERVHVIDDVVVGEDVAARVEDDAGAHAVDALRLNRLAERVVGRGVDGPLAVDVDDRRLDLVVNVDDLILALAGRDLPVGGADARRRRLKGGGDGGEPDGGREPGGHEQPAAGGTERGQR